MPFYDAASNTSRPDQQGDIRWALIMNYMFDPTFMFSACPQILDIPKVVWFHDHDDINMWMRKAWHILLDTSSNASQNLVTRSTRHPVTWRAIQLRRGLVKLTM